MRGVISYSRWLLKRAYEVQRDEDLPTLVSKGKNHTILELWRFIGLIPILGPYMLKKSLQRLNERMKKEGTVKDIIDTAYNFRGMGPYKTIKPMHQRENLEQFTEWVDERSINSVLEIGTARGGTLYIWSRLFDATIVAVDINFMDREDFLGNIDRDNSLSLIEGDSHSDNVFSEVKEACPERGFDMIYIDGDHSYHGAKEDFEVYRDFLSDTGIVVFDDIYSDWGVADFWQELTKKHDTKEIPNENSRFGIVKHPD